MSGPGDQEPLTPDPEAPPPSTASSRPAKKASPARKAVKKAAPPPPEPPSPPPQHGSTAAPTERLPAGEAVAEPHPDPLQPTPGVAGSEPPGVVTTGAAAPGPGATRSVTADGGDGGGGGGGGDGGGGGNGAGGGGGGDDDSTNGGYATIEGIVWRPVHRDADQARRLATSWSYAGAAAALVIFVFVFTIVGLADEFTAGLVALTGAVALGALLVIAGLGLLQLEALRAQAVPLPQVSDELRTRTLGPTSAPPLSADVLKVLVQGLSGLTAARAAIFAGAFLLAVAAIGGGIGLAGDDGEDGDGNGSSPTPTATTTP